MPSGKKSRQQRQAAVPPVRSKGGSGGGSRFSRRTLIIAGVVLVVLIGLGVGLPLALGSGGGQPGTSTRVEPIHTASITTLGQVDPAPPLGTAGPEGPPLESGPDLAPAGSPSPDQDSRRVWPGEGEIPLREWVDAIRATGFDGWWDNELYSPLHWEMADPFAVGAGLLEVLRGLLQA